jgi:hypothetical protein
MDLIDFNDLMIQFYIKLKENKLNKLESIDYLFFDEYQDVNPIQNQILKELLNLSDHIPAILCLTILNNQCKKYDIKIHGYYLAAGIDVLMLMAKVCSNRDYFENKYGSNAIDNMIIEVTSWFYHCILQNIETLRLSKYGKINHKISQLCAEYATKYLPLITQKHTHISNTKMKKTDIFCFDFDNQNCIIQYKRKSKLEKDIIIDDINKRYGSVCKLAICLGWILGQGDEQNISNLEGLGDHIGLFLKMYDDFKYLERDMIAGDTSFNYIVNYGIKEAYIELIESKTNFIEESMKLGIHTKTSKEIIDMVVRDIDNIVKDISIDMDTQYDDVSTI